MLNVGGGPKVVVSTAAFHEFGVCLSVSAVWKKQTCFFPIHSKKLSIVGSFRDREVTCSTSDFQGFNFESCDWRVVSSHSFRHPQEVLVAQFNVHKSGLKPNSFHLIFVMLNVSTKRYRDQTLYNAFIPGDRYPSKHMLYKIYTTSAQRRRRCINVIQMFCVCWDGVSDYNDHVIYWTVSVKMYVRFHWRMYCFTDKKHIIKSGVHKWKCFPSKYVTDGWCIILVW